MPSNWYNIRACGGNRNLQSLCAYRKPYFMIYVYSETKKLYREYVQESNSKSMALYNCTIDELYDKEGLLTEEQMEFLFWYEYKMPVGIGDCSMNKICRYVEKELDGYKSQLHRTSSFDYTLLKASRRCTDEHRLQLKELEQEYRECVSEYKKQPKSNNKGESKHRRLYLRKRFSELAREICPNDDERMNIILDITYANKGNRQFCWDCIGELIVRRLEELEGLNVRSE